MSTNGHRRVVVTGVGAVTPLGNDADTSWRRLLAGESGAEEITLFDHTDYPVHFACELKDFEPTKWLERIDAVKKGGIAAVADAVIAGWLTQDFRERAPDITARMKAMLLASPVEGYLACCEALSTLDQRALLPKIKSPTLVIAGRHDMATPISAGELIRSNIPGASMTIIDAAHISNVEQPHAFTDAVVGFLTQR